MEKKREPVITSVTYDYGDFSFDICSSLLSPYAWEVYLITFPVGWVDCDCKLDLDVRLQCINAETLTQAMYAALDIIDEYYKWRSTQ